MAELPTPPITPNEASVLVHSFGSTVVGNPGFAGCSETAEYYATAGWVFIRDGATIQAFPAGEGISEDATCTAKADAEFWYEHPDEKKRFRQWVVLESDTLAPVVWGHSDNASLEEAEANAKEAAADKRAEEYGAKYEHTMADFDDGNLTAIVEQ